MSILTRRAPPRRARTPTTAPRACARSPTSRPRLGPRRASPSATRPGTTMARPWRTGRSLRSSSTPRLSHPTPRPLLPLPRSRAPGGLLCSEVADGQGSGRQPLSGLGGQGRPDPALSRGSAHCPCSAGLPDQLPVLRIRVGCCLVFVSAARGSASWIPVPLVGDHVRGP